MTRPTSNGTMPDDVTRPRLPGNTRSAPVDWAVSDASVPYEIALAAMEARIEKIANGGAPELIWLLEHPPLYTAGTSARSADLLDPDRFPVFETGRGGQYTYHGPGQRVAYVMLDLRARGRDVRAFITLLEGWIIDTLAQFNVRGEIHADRVGVWVARPHHVPHYAPGAEDKIAAIGLRLRRWISYHGLSINLEPNLEHFTGIVPCGVSQHGVTSLADLGLVVSMPELDMAMAAAFEDRIADIRRTEPPA
jgi:lipoyl(octanoyl) transferase